MFSSHLESQQQQTQNTQRRRRPVEERLRLRLRFHLGRLVRQLLRYARLVREPRRLKNDDRDACGLALRQIG